MAAAKLIRAVEIKIHSWQMENSENRVVGDGSNSTSPLGAWGRSKIENVIKFAVLPLAPKGGYWRHLNNIVTRHKEDFSFEFNSKIQETKVTQFPFRG